MNERSDPLSRMMWSMCQIILKHFLPMKAKREFQDFHIPLWSIQNQPDDKLFNQRHDKINHFI